LAFARGVREYDWYTFYDYEVPSQALVAPEAYFGIVSPGDYAKPLDFKPDGNNPPRPKLSFYALRTLLAETGGASEIADYSGLDRERGIRLIAVRGGGKTVLVAWFSGLAGTQDVVLPPDLGEPTSAAGISGEAVDRPTLLAPVSLTPDPIYIRY
jgi:hypothetical protein